MGSETAVRNQFGTIIGLQPKQDVDPVQATLDASLKAVGATPPSGTPTTPLPVPQTPPRPSWRLIATGVAVLSLGVLAIVFLSGRTTTAPTIIVPTVTAVPTPLPTQPPTTLPSVVPLPSPHEVTLAAITLYGDYDETTKIGPAPEGITCTLSGQSPDGQWAFLSCPAPTGNVWAKLGTLGLSAEGRSVLLDSRVIVRIVPTVPAFSPSQPQSPGLTSCADRSSIWGNTHRCASTQAAADALADSEMRRINGDGQATATALNK